MTSYTLEFMALDKLRKSSLISPLVGGGTIGTWSPIETSSSEGTWLSYGGTWLSWSPTLSISSSALLEASLLVFIPITKTNYLCENT